MQLSANAIIAPYVGKNRAGWQDDEDAMLWAEVELAQKEGRPLKSAFDLLSQKTGRKSNSIRNYYYAKAKENDGHRSATFVPFSQDEIWKLLVDVLGAQAQGVSVRACTLRLANNDTRDMLRYQNKYRSLIKTNPKLVGEVITYMRENDMPCFDPYEGGRTSFHKAGRPKKQEQDCQPEDVLSGMLSMLNLMERVDDLAKRMANLELTVQELEQDSFSAISLN